MTEPAGADLVGAVFGGRYRVERLLGSGGAGAVYRAVRQDDGVAVALKVVHAEHQHNDEVVARFHREIRATSMIDHPNTARVVDSGTHDGRVFLAFELLEGRSLEDLLVDEGPLAPADVVRLGRQIASALAAAHAHGITHRDLKPENVLLVPGDDGVEVVKVVDFGLALAASGSDAKRLTTIGARVGTPHYMAPEYIQDPNEVDPRGDLYSLGVILFQLVTGQTPFRDRNPYVVLRKHVTEPPPDPATLAPGCPPWLRDLILALLAKKPGDRPQTADDVVARLDVADADPPAPRAAPASRATTPWWIAALAVLAAVLVGLAIARAAGALP